VVILHCQQNRCQTKLKAELEGNAEQVTCMDRLYHQFMQTVPMPTKSHFS